MGFMRRMRRNSGSVRKTQGKFAPWIDSIRIMDIETEMRRKDEIKRMDEIKRVGELKPNMSNFDLWLPWIVLVLVLMLLLIFNQ